MAGIPELENGLLELKKVRDRERLKWNEERLKWKTTEKEYQIHIQDIQEELKLTTNTAMEEKLKNAHEISTLAAELERTKAARDSSVGEMVQLSEQLQKMAKEFDLERVLWNVEQERFKAEYERLHDEVVRSDELRKREKLRLQIDLGLVGRGITQIKDYIVGLSTTPSDRYNPGTQHVVQSADLSNPLEWSELIRSVLEELNRVEVILLKEIWVRDAIATPSYDRPPSRPSSLPLTNPLVLKRSPTLSSKRSASPKRASTSSPKPKRAPSPISFHSRPMSPLVRPGTNAAMHSPVDVGSVEYDRLSFDLHVAWQTGREVSSELRWLRRQLSDEQRYYNNKLKQMERDLQFEIRAIKRQHELHLKEVKDQAQRDIKQQRKKERK